MSAVVNNFCTLDDPTECNRMFCHLILKIVKIMNAIQPIRGQESLYKLYNTSRIYFGGILKLRVEWFLSVSHEVLYSKSNNVFYSKYNKIKLCAHFEWAIS